MDEYGIGFGWLVKEWHGYGMFCGLGLIIVWYGI